MDNLEKKAKDMESVNSNLQQEVVMLRSEVQQLKSILIAHKDCPLIVHHTKGMPESLAGSAWCIESLMLCSISMILTEGDVSDRGNDGGVTLLAQLANMPSMSPLITSPVPSVGSVVPNITPTLPQVLSQQQSQLPTTIVIATNGLNQQTPEVYPLIQWISVVFEYRVLRGFYRN